MELLLHDVIENILERLDVRTLLKFKSVSKQWKSTIQSPSFQQRQLLRRQSSSIRGDPHVMLLSKHDLSVLHPHPDFEAMRTLVVGSPSVSVKFPIPWQDYNVCNTSCDGLICIYDFRMGLQSIVINPATLWHRTIPPSNYQRVIEMFEIEGSLNPSMGFGKDKISGTYKLVWLYNSTELGLNNDITTCEVFDFATNSWRYIVPASPYPIIHSQDPVFVDGSLHWFTEGETMVLSLDLHTETFQIIAKTPFLETIDLEVMCNLDDRLCVSREKWRFHVVWSFDPDHKTWSKVYSIGFPIASYYFRNYIPLAVLGKDKLLLLYDFTNGSLVTLDPKTKSYKIAYTSQEFALACCYYPSLISIL